LLIFAQDFWKEYFEKHEYELFHDYSIEENINLNILIEKLVRLNPRVEVNEIIEEHPWRNIIRNPTPSLVKLYHGKEELTELKFIDFSLTGIKILPKEIGNLVNLEYLDLSDNQFTEIPKEIEKLTKLKELNLNSNKIKKIPKEIEKLTKLEKLWLYDNQIKEIPKEVKNLPKLRILTENQ